MGAAATSGQAWWVFAAIWSALLAVCLWSAAMSTVEFSRSLAELVTPLQALGFAVQPNTPEPTVALVTPAAARAGLHRGERPLTIDGRRDHRPELLDALGEGGVDR